MSKSTAPQPLARVLATTPTIAGWHARALAEAELTAAVRRHLPRAIAERVRVADAGESTLTLAANSGTVAAVVRQRLPVIQEELKREGCNFTEIKVRVQVRIDPPGGAKSLEIQRERVDTAPLKRLAEKLADGPLKAAIQRLARRI